MSVLNVIYRDNGKLLQVWLDSDGREVRKDELKVQKVGPEVRYTEKDTEHAEYFIIGDEGELVFWGEPLEGVEHKPFARALARDKPEPRALRKGRTTKPKVRSFREYVDREPDVPVLEFLGRIEGRSDRFTVLNEDVAIPTLEVSEDARGVFAVIEPTTATSANASR